MSSNDDEIRIRLDRGTDPITGSVRRAGSEPRPFSGWLGMAGAIELLLEGRGPEPASQSAERLEPSTTPSEED